MKHPKRLAVFFLLASCVTALTCATAHEKLDQQTLEMISKIRYEGFRNSRVMEIASGLMDGIGPRLTGSPNMKRANEWTRDKLTEFGLSNAHLESWGPFGRGWANESVSVRMTSPDIASLLAYAKAWTPGTDGPVKAQVVRVNIRTPQDLARYKGKLTGKIVLLGDDIDIKPSLDPLMERYTEKALADLEHYSVPPDRNLALLREFQQRGRVQRTINKFFDDEKPVA